MIGYMRLSTFGLLFCALLLFTATPSFADDNILPLRFSTETVQIKGVFSKTPLSARVTLLTNTEVVSDIKLLPSDLVDTEGNRIPANGYQISPLSITSLAANSGELVTLSISNIPGAGTYAGTVTVLYTGAAPTNPLMLDVQVVAEADPTAEIELEPNAAKIVIKSTRAWFPRRMSLIAPTTFHLRQAGSTPAQIVSITPMRPATADEILPIPDNVLIVTPTTPLILEPNRWQPISVQADLARLPAGHYGGTLVLSPQQGDDQQVVIDLQVRDACIWPLLMLFIGVGLSSVIAFMTATGSARLTILRTIDRLQRQVATGVKLPMESLSEWRLKLNALDEKAKTVRPETVQSEINGIEAELQAALAVTEGYIKQLDDWREQFDYWSTQDDEYLAAFLESPLIRSLRAHLKTARDSLLRGGYDHGETRGMLAQLTKDTTAITDLVNAFDPIRTSIIPDIEKIRATLVEELKGVEGLRVPPLSDLFNLLKQHKLIKADSVQQPGAFSAPAEEITKPITERPKTETRPNRLQRAWNRFISMLRTWLDPRKYLPVLSAVLGGLFLILLLAAGMEALYVNKSTFGANVFGDYLGVLLWGIGADASRKQLHNLENATGYLRQRLGLPEIAAGT